MDQSIEKTFQNFGDDLRKNLFFQSAKEFLLKKDFDTSARCLKAFMNDINQCKYKQNRFNEMYLQIIQIIPEFHDYLSGEDIYL